MLCLDELRSLTTGAVNTGKKLVFGKPAHSPRFAVIICWCVQVEKVYIGPSGQQFDSWSDVKRYCEDEGIPIEAAQDVPDSDAEPEPDFALAEIMTWLRGVAVTSPERPLIGGGRLMRQAVARMRTCLSKDPSGSALSRRVM